MWHHIERGVNDFVTKHDEGGVEGVKKRKIKRDVIWTALSVNNRLLFKAATHFKVF